jgi:hypothetical protein
MNCADAFMSDSRVRAPSDIVLLVDEENANSGFFCAVDPNEETGLGNGSPDALTKAPPV